MAHTAPTHQASSNHSRLQGWVDEVAALTQPDEAIADFVRQLQLAAAGKPLEFLHLLLDHLHAEFACDAEPAQTPTTAAEAFALRRGTCQDLTHIFIAAARRAEVPARCVGGYVHRADAVPAPEAGRSWAEAFVPDFGWIGFDPTNGILCDHHHIFAAVGLTPEHISPTRGNYYHPHGVASQMSSSLHVHEKA